MSVFTAKKLKEARSVAGFSQEEVAKKMKMKVRQSKKKPERKECLYLLL